MLTEALRTPRSEKDRETETSEHKVFIPSSKDVEIFLKLAEKDLSIVKVDASYAVAYYVPREG